MEGSTGDFLSPTTVVAGPSDPAQVAYLRAQTLRSISIRDPSSFPYPSGGAMGSGEVSGVTWQPTGPPKSYKPQGMLALIDAVLADDSADPTLKRLAGLARSEMAVDHSRDSVPEDTQVPPGQPPGLPSAFHTQADPTLFSLGSSDSPRLPVSVIAPTSAGGANHLIHTPGSNMMHPY